jgi:hypothetical protein
MATVKPGRNPIVAQAFAGLRADERRMARIQKAYRTKPIAEPEAAPAQSKKPAKAARAKATKPRKTRCEPSKSTK